MKKAVIGFNNFTLIYCVMFAVFIAVLFTVPYLFPVEQMSISASYDYGFNNQLGILLLALFSILIILFSFMHNKSGNYQTVISINENVIKPNKVFFIVASINVIGCFILWSIIGIHTNNYLGEASNFIVSIYEIIFGRTVFRDFYWIYGPVLLYFPYYSYKLFSLFSFTVLDGYMIALIASQVTGLYFIYYILSFMKFASGEKKVIFIIIAILSFPLSIGLNYTLFRFTLPYFCFVLLEQIRKKTKTKLALYIILSIFFSCLTLLTSPELGVGFCFTLVVYLVVTCLFEKKRIYLIQICLLLSSYILFFWLFQDMFKGFSGFITGALNWPFVPGMGLLIFFISVFVISKKIGIQLHGIYPNLFNLSFILLSFSFIPGVLGRCDPGHIIWNGLFILLVAYQYIRLISKPVKIISGIVLVLFCLSGYPYSLKIFVPAYGYRFLKNMEMLDSLPTWVVSFANIWGIDIEERIISRRENNLLDYEDIFKDINDVATPLGKDFGMYIFLNQSKKYMPLYYNGFLDGSEYSVKRTLLDIEEKTPQHILVPEEWRKMSEPYDYSIINQVFFTYYPAKVKRNGNVVFEPLLEYIDKNYVYYQSIGNYQLLRKSVL